MSFPTDRPRIARKVIRLRRPVEEMTVEEMKTEIEQIRELTRRHIRERLLRTLFQSPTESLAERIALAEQICRLTGV